MARVFGHYTVFRDNAAMLIKPVAPKFKQMPEFYALARHGSVWCEFAKKVDTAKTFDWSNKDIFSLSVSEIGLFAVTPPNQPIELVREHYNAAEQKMVRLKTLRVQPEAGGVVFTLEVAKDNTKTSVLLSNAEMFVVKNIMFSVLPYLCGFPQTVTATNITDAQIMRDFPSESA